MTPDNDLSNRFQTKLPVDGALINTLDFIKSKFLYPKGFPHNSNKTKTGSLWASEPHI